MRTPNQEQQPAIAHRGGVLLKAGAGSGKTFVLVEHLVHLTREWRGEWERNPGGTSFGEFLAAKYASTVLMTFTKLAAGEILVRLTQRFQDEADAASESERAWWAEVLRQLDRLTVTTIDGYFSRLIRRGYFPHLPPSVPIIMEGPRRKRLLALFDAWWEARAPGLPAATARDLSLHRDALSESLLTIFNDPALRDTWVAFRPADAAPENLGWVAAELPALEGWTAFLSAPVPEVPAVSRAKGLKWVALADALEKRPRTAGTWEDILEWARFAESDVGRTVLSASAKEAIGEDYLETWKSFRDSVKKWATAYKQYQASYAEKILPWFSALSDLVAFVDSSLSPTEGLTYGDLEYHVLRALRDPSTAARVRADYSYFVVDEFQDTSRVQYEALDLLTGGDPRRMFCVGDAKQAIYGFRGGELGVFLGVEAAPGVTTLPLSSNYRSSGNVIAFNNALFQALFPLGEGWEGRDAHAVSMEPQMCPPERAGEDPGRVVVLDVELPDVRDVDPGEKEKKRPAWRTSHLHEAEAAVVADWISARLPTLGGGRIAVLYKKLAPSSALMAALMARGVGFTAQAKIPFGDDPVAGMLNALLQDLLGKKGGRWAEFMVMGYLRLLGITPGEEVQRAAAAFPPDRQLYGLGAAFTLFLSRLGLANGLHGANLAAVEEVLALGGGDPEAVWARLSELADQRWSADFRFGEDPGRVVLQTSHGSKGLEYDVVVVGGAATNGRAMASREWAGSLPGAAVWMEDAAERRRESTPQLLFERALAKKKDFSESKRLFYVACTRAKRELVIPRFRAPEGQLAGSVASWGAGLEKFLETTTSAVHETVRAPLPAREAGSERMPPFFHLNPLGLSRRDAFAAAADHGVTSELSVTRLGALLECPRKFYFKNVLRLPEVEEERTETRPSAFGEGEDAEAPRPLSSSERGSAVHLGLHQAITRRMTLPLEWVNAPEKEGMEWVLAELRRAQEAGATFVSEEQLKFPLFGFMLTGIPDLLVLWGHAAEVWDFKTGRRGENKELKYWQQLEAYAYALWEAGRVPHDRPIRLRLAYVDQKSLVEREITYAGAKNSLFTGWSALARLNETNLAHCSVCPFRGVCPR